MELQQTPRTANIRNINPNINLGIGPELVDHANRLGIKLRSAGKIRQMPNSARGSRPHVITADGYPVAKERLPLSAWERPHTSIISAPQYVQNFVVPLSVGTDEENVRQSVVPHSLRGNKNLPYMNRGTGNLSARSARSNTSASTYLSRYLTTTPVENSVNKRGCKENRQWNSSDQALRFQHERDQKQDGLRKKRMSEIQGHRVDRMYYMSGSSLGMNGRYSVDQEELDRLQEMSKVRREAAHYGRGLSIEKRKLLQHTSGSRDDFQEIVVSTSVVPRQPPPSQIEGRLSAHSTAQHKAQLERLLTVNGQTLGSEENKQGLPQLSPANDTATLKNKQKETSVPPPQNTARTDDTQGQTQVNEGQDQSNGGQGQEKVKSKPETVEVPLPPTSDTAKEDNQSDNAPNEISTNENADQTEKRNEPIKINGATNNDNDEESAEKDAEQS